MEKLTIIGYKDNKFKQKISGTSEMEVQINPESVSHGYNLMEYNDKTSKYGVTGGVGDLQIAGAAPEDVSFKLVFDSTGIIPDSKTTGCTSVLGAIDTLKNIVYKFNGDTHGHNYVQLVWGKLFSSNKRLFRCLLSKIDVEYTLFRPDGEPVRAEVTISFNSYVSRDEAVKEMNMNSPDMSHYYTVRQGDRLTNLCYDIYGSNQYYLEVAKVNNLININRLVPGQKLLFPPLGR